jgi:CNT family concentrative nucleoside transporter
MGWLNLVSLLGFVVFAGVAWLAGGRRQPFPARTVAGAGALMGALGVVVFLVPQTRALLLWANDVVLAVLGAANAGAEFLFGPLAVGPGRASATGEPSIGFVLAAQVLPAVVFFAAVMAMLYHLRLLQPVVRTLGRLFHRTLSLSGAEALAGSANVFFGVESATTVRPYLERMTRSELLTVLTCGMSTVASTTLAIYVLFLRDVFPQIAGHLISASVLSIPAAVLCSKLLLPETGEPETMGKVPPVADGERHGNTIAALAAGSWDGLKLAAGISTLLIAILGVVGVLDLALGEIGSVSGEPLSLSLILGWLFTPVAWLLGIESGNVQVAGQLLGERLILTEIPAYRELGALAQAGALSARTVVILSYALCGFTHVASMGIFVGGFAALAPSRRNDLAALGPKALLGAVLATLMTGSLAGVLFSGQTLLLSGVSP